MTPADKDLAKLARTPEEVAGEVFEKKMEKLKEDPTHSQDRTVTHTLLFSSIRCVSTL